MNDVIERLRAFVAEGAHRGVVLESSQSAPTGANLAMTEGRVGRWLNAQRFDARVPDFVPASYRAFLERYGSLTWLAPDVDLLDGAFSLKNQGAFALIDIPEGSQCIDLFEQVPDEEEQQRIGLDQLWVFHDGYSESFAFDARVKNEHGEPLVVRFEDHHVMESLDARRDELELHGTFETWLTTRIERFMAALADRTARPNATQLAAVPTDIAVPPERAHDAKQFHVQLMKGLQQSSAGEREAARKTAKGLLSTAPNSAYAMSLALDVAADANELHRIAWQLLAMCRGVVKSLHADYVKLYRQRAATVLAELALTEPSLVSPDDAELLITEALSIAVGEDDQTPMTGTWNTKAIAKQLGHASSRK